MPALTLPWRLEWSTGKAAGTYTLTQPPLGIGRTYAINGVGTSLTAGVCYVVRVAGEGIGPVQDSPRGCGPASPATFALKVTQIGAFTPVNIRLCRAGATGGGLACGPALPLSGIAVTSR